MAKCQNGCGRDVPASKGYKPRKFCGDACRVAYGRAHKKSAAKDAPSAARIESLAIETGDVHLVERVAQLVAPQLAGHDEIAAAQAALSLKLAALASDGSVSAARELRLLLLELRVATDPTWEGEETQALALQCLLRHIGLNNEESATVWRESGDRAWAPTPPGWRSTAQDGQILEFIGCEWMRLRDGGDVEGVRNLTNWVGAHCSELDNLRRMGRWSVWPENADSI